MTQHMRILSLTLAQIFSLSFSVPVRAVGFDLGDEINKSLNYGTITGLGTQDIRHVAMVVINVILGFLTVISIILMIWGGYKWMTSGGNENQVAEAKRVIIASIIGMTVIFVSYAITIFVLRSLVNTTR